jgi:hypothetical protein
MKMHIAALAFCALLVFPVASFAQNLDNGGAAPNAASGPVKPGTVRVTTRAPEPGKWDASNGPGRRIFKCKPLACADQETVSFIFAKSPTSKPDPKALEKLAAIDLPKSMRAAAAARAVYQQIPQKIDTLASKTATLKGFPSIFNETKYSFGKSSAYIDTAIIFAGPVMIRIASTSPDRDLAHKSLDEFVEVMAIVQGPALTAPGGAPTKPSDSGTTSL